MATRRQRTENPARPAPKPARPDDAMTRKPYEQKIRAILVEHLGSENAADAWLDSEHTGYPTSARDAIENGHAELVLADLESQWGPSPSYA